MAEFDLNLSTRPFPAYRLINLALASVLIALIVVSVWQAYGFVQFSSMTRTIRDTDQEARVESEALGRRVAELEGRLDRPEAAAKLTEIGFLNRLILRKELSWTRLFANLEEMVPDSVHLVSLTPDVGTEGAVILYINIRGRSVTDDSKFIEALERSPVFEKVVVSVEQKGDLGGSTDVAVSLKADYYPQRETR
jgi:hypothetical protein